MLRTVKDGSDLLHVRHGSALIFLSVPSLAIPLGKFSHNLVSRIVATRTQRTLCAKMNIVSVSLK